MAAMSVMAKYKAPQKTQGKLASQGTQTVTASATSATATQALNRRSYIMTGKVETENVSQHTLRDGLRMERNNDNDDISNITGGGDDCQGQVESTSEPQLCSGLVRTTYNNDKDKTINNNDININYISLLLTMGKVESSSELPRRAGLVRNTPTATTTTTTH